MDGPNINLKVLNDLIRNLQNLSTALLNVGNCELYVIHDAFKTGIKKFKWEIVSFLRAIYYLFKDSPIRRATPNI